MKRLPLLMVLLITALFTSCNEENGLEKDTGEKDTSFNNEKNYVFTYRTDSEKSDTRATGFTSKYWPLNSRIRIKFLNGSDAAQQKVKYIASEWLNHAALSFEYVNSNADADVKIAFQWNGDQVSWSMIGIDCKSVPQNQPSTNLMLFSDSDLNTEDFAAIVLREFGHILGLIFENQSPDSRMQWNMSRVKTYFKSQSWTQDQIDELIRIYSRTETNYTTFDEESIMLLYFPGYLTTDGNGTRWNTTLSNTDKQFIRSIYPGQLVLPERIALEYRQANDPVAYPYTGVRIGEYYWIDNNFYHMAPRQGGLFDAGGESDITTEMFDTYMKAAHLDLNNRNAANFPNQVYNIENFYRYYGRYYNRASINYMTAQGKMYEAGSPSSGWKLPSYVDYRQLLAMCPFQSDESLSNNDVQVALAARYGDNPATSPYYVEVHNKLIQGEHPDYYLTCKDEHGRISNHAVYWNTSDLRGLPVKNIYGFNMMAGGARGNNTWIWPNGLYDIETGERDHYGINQYLYHLFYTVGLYTVESHIYIHDFLDTNRGPSNHWYNARWCRKLTDRELGYKLYINQQQTDIKKLALTENAPAGYTELPNGYLRGFYVQYILDNPNPKYTISDIVRFSKNVKDTTL